MDPNISLLAAYPGDYRQQLISQLFFALGLDKDGILVIPGVKNDLQMHKFVVGDGVKPYTGFFNPKDDITFIPRVLSVKPAQRDLRIEPKKYLPTFMAKMRGKGEGANNQKIPFAEFMYAAVLKGIASEIVMQSVYHGVGKAAFTAFNPATNYTVGALITYTQSNEVRYFRCVTATTAGQTPDSHAAKWVWAGGKAVTVGLGKIIDDGITAGDIVPIATGALTNSNAYAKFSQMRRSLPEQIKVSIDLKEVIYCSQTDYELLCDDYEDKVSKNFERVDGITYLAKTDRKCEIRPVPWLSGSRRLIATVYDNLVAGTDELSDMNEIRTVPQMYTVDCGITFVIGFQIQDLDALRVSDQA